MKCTWRRCHLDFNATKTYVDTAEQIQWPEFKKSIFKKPSIRIMTSTLPLRAIILIVNFSRLSEIKEMNSQPFLNFSLLL